MHTYEHTCQTEGEGEHAHPCLFPTRIDSIPTYRSNHQLSGMSFDNQNPCPYPTKTVTDGTDPRHTIGTIRQASPDIGKRTTTQQLYCLSSRVTTKMLSYHYYVEYLSRILDSYSYSFVVRYSFVKTDSKIFANESQKGNNSMLYKRTIALALAYLP